jgi:RNA polymerase sigma factor
MFQLLAALQDILADERTVNAPAVRTDRLEDKVRRIQAGDEDLRNQVISDCLPYIKGVLRRMLQLSDIEQRDEFSIALTAFNDALDRYIASTNVPFLRFAGLVINRRIIDWIRQQKANSQVLTFSQCEADQGDSFTDTLGSIAGDSVWDNMEIEEELIRLRLRLQDFGLSLQHLVKVFPKHRDTRLALIRMARQLMATPKLLQRFERDCRLPAAELSRCCGVPLKTIERNRPSIIFLVLLLGSDLDVIKSYLVFYSKEAKT